MAVETLVAAAAARPACRSVTVDSLEAAASWLRGAGGPCLIALHEARHVEPWIALVASAGSGLAQEPVWLALDFDVELALRQRGLSYVTPEQYLERDDYAAIQQEATALGGRWFLALADAGEPDVTVYDGLSLGELLQWEMGYFFAEAMRCLVNMQRVAERLQPAVILFADSPSGSLHGLLRQDGEDFHRLAAEALPGAPATIVRVMMPEAPRVSRDSLSVWTQQMKAWTGHGLHRLMGWSLRVSQRIRQATPPLLITDVKHLGTDVGRLLVRDRRAAVIVAEETWSPRLWWRLFVHRAGTWQAPLAGTCVSRAAQERLEAGLRRITAAIDRCHDRPQALTFRGVSLAPFLEERLRYLQATRWRQMLIAIERWRRYLRAWRVGVVVVGEDLSPKKKLLVRVAQQLRIPTVVAQHGLYVDPFMQVLHADYLAAWGNSTERFLEAGGVATHRIRITGAPRFDRLERLQRRRPELRREVGRALGLNPDHPVVVFTTQGVQRGTYFPGNHFSPQENYAMCRAALNAVQRLPEAQLIIKFHVTEPHASRIERMLAEEFGPERFRCVQSADLYRLLCAADCLLTGFSTTGLEAIAAGVPVVELRLREQPYMISYADSGAALEARTSEALEDALRRILNGSPHDLQPLTQGMARFWRDTCGCAVGEASSRMAEFLAELRDADQALHG